MKTRFYLLIGLAAFVVAVTGSDLLARMMIAGESFPAAATGHLDWLSQTVIGNLFLLAPFAIVAMICAFVGERVNRATALSILGVALFALISEYFQGFQEAQRAVLEQRWTASAMSVAFLPIYAGATTVFFTVIAACVAAMISKNKAVD